jgi:hypothetical protein
VRIPASAFVSVVALAASAAHAANYPSINLLPGETAQSVVSNLCYIVRGPSVFERNNAGTVAYVTVAEMTANGSPMNGKMNLRFTSTTAGTVAFAYGNIATANFTNYAQNYDLATKFLTVHFTLSFSGCTLPVYASYASY